jgi:biofilm PGA synthesis N-glycosyltransferase PgaC
MSSQPKYIIITPARNEADFIEFTIKSMVAQTARPLRWVIVSDGSTDKTEEIVERYLPENPWIELVKMPPRQERHFAGKVIAFNAGLERVKSLPYGFIGSLDADISFDPEYFDFLLNKLAGDMRLGLVGTPFVGESDRMYNYKFTNIEHVSGACQFFRRKCFEEIGGYVPIKAGGIDYVMVISARMKGWKTRTFLDKQCFHHRGMGTAQNGPLQARFRNGIKDNAFGNHPLWELSRVAYQLTQPPRLVGGLMLGAGYFWAQITRAKRPVSKDLVAFVRREQMERLQAIVFRKSRPEKNSEASFSR